MVITIRKVEMDEGKSRNRINLFFVIIAFCFFLSGCGAKAEKKTDVKSLTLAVFEYGSQQRDSDLRKRVNQYNGEHPEVQIEIVNYLERYPDQEEAINQIKIEINAGKGPDMINFGRQYSPLDASNGMLADLYPLMQTDETFDKGDYYYNIMEAFAVDDSLYVIVPSYIIDTYATGNEQLAGLDGMSVDELVDAYNKLEAGSILFPGETKKAVFGMICYGSMENYINWDEGTCNFHGESFKKVLRFADSFPLNLNIEEDYSAKTVYMEGRALLYPVSIGNVYNVTGVRMLYGRTPAYIGYPVDSGCGSMAQIADIAIGISSTSKQKEEAWNFIRSLLDSEFQDMMEDGLPLRVSSLEQNLENAMREEFDANGEKIAKETVRFEGEEPENIYAITAEDAETLKSMIQKIEYNASVDINLYNILLEETEYLFYDNRDVDAVADIIQNRASIYISEKK